MIGARHEKIAGVECRPEPEPKPTVGRMLARVASGAGPLWEGFRGRLVERKTLRCWELLLGMILFFSPWLFGLSAGAQWQTASTVGIFIAVLSVAALAAFAIWEEWLNLIVGLWLIASPWLLGFQDSSAMAVDVSIGAVVAILAALEVWLTHDTQPRLTATRETAPPL